MGVGPGPELAIGGIFFLVWLAMVIVMVGGWVALLIAAWRGMKAHESIARSLEEIANKP